MKPSDLFTEVFDSFRFTNWKIPVSIRVLCLCLCLSHSLALCILWPFLVYSLCVPPVSIQFDYVKINFRQDKAKTKKNDAKTLDSIDSESKGTPDHTLTHTPKQPSFNEISQSIPCSLTNIRQKEPFHFCVTIWTCLFSIALSFHPVCTTLVWCCSLRIESN